MSVILYEVHTDSDPKGICGVLITVWSCPSLGQRSWDDATPHVLIIDCRLAWRWERNANSQALPAIWEWQL